MSSGAASASHFLSKKVGKAIWDYKMLKEGDRVLLAVSGGKDSLSLLRIMKERLKFVPIEYEIVACHVDMGFDWVDAEALKAHFEREGVRYVVGEAGKGMDGKQAFHLFLVQPEQEKGPFQHDGRDGLFQIGPWAPHGRYHRDDAP